MRRRQFGADLDASGAQHTGPGTFATKADASRYLAQIEVEMARGDWRDPRAGRVTFADWADDYVPYAHHKRGTTLTRDRGILRAHLLPALADRQLSSITPMDVRRLLEGWTNDHKPSTVRTIYGVLRTILNTAVEADILVVSPCRGVRLPSDAPAEKRFLSAESVISLAEAIEVRDRSMVLLAGVLGLRWSEVAGLPVGRLDLPSGTITVSTTLGMEGLGDGTTRGTVRRTFWHVDGTVGFVEGGRESGTPERGV